MEGFCSPGQSALGKAMLSDHVNVYALQAPSSIVGFERLRTAFGLVRRGRHVGASVTLC